MSSERFHETWLAVWHQPCSQHFLSKPSISVLDLFSILKQEQDYL
jgi:hypothetical protein